MRFLQGFCWGMAFILVLLHFYGSDRSQAKGRLQVATGEYVCVEVDGELECKKADQGGSDE